MKTKKLSARLIAILALLSALLMPINYVSADNTSPLCFTARNGSVTVRFEIKNATHTIQYSTDSINWNNYVSNRSVWLSVNEKVYFRAEFNQTIATSFVGSQFEFFSYNGGMIEASGNIMSLYGPDCPNLPLQPAAFVSLFYNCQTLLTAPSLSATTLADHCYSHMFYGCTSLTTSPALPATTLANDCYSYMFRGCTSLTTAPALPATTLADNCYYNMFHGCTSLTTSPALPATTLADYCYSNMFNDCTSLTTAPALPATTLTDNCYSYMFYGCTSLTTAPALPATTLANYCYSYMFSYCTSLTIAPALPATTLADYCYSNMFIYCTSLTTAPTLPATTLADWCYSAMFYGCASLTTAPALPATTLADNCYYNMFHGCTSLTTSPALPATTLADHCYCDMFHGCTSLTTSPALPATTLADYCYSSMFNDCTSLTTAPALPATTLTDNCYSYMFYGCTSLTTAPALPATTLTDRCYSGMFYGCTSLVVNNYYPGTQWRISATQQGKNSLDDMLVGTGGNVRFMPSINTTYYIASDILHTVTVNVNNQSMGSVTGGGQYHHGSMATLTAHANNNYRLAFWSNGKSTPTITFRVYGDSTITATFAVSPTYFMQDTHSMCQGESYYWHRKTLTTSGIYYDSLKSRYGSDSVYKLTLTVNPSYLISETHSICQGESYSWHGRTLTDSGVYYDSILTNLGCDSIHCLTLTVNPTYLFRNVDTICGVPYIWHNKAILKSGIYYDSLLTVAGCDSVYELTAIINQYTIVVNSNDELMGSVTGGGSYQCGDTVYLSAVENEGYKFVSWSNGIKSQNLQFVVTENTTLVAYFEPMNYNVIANANYANRGVVTGSGVYSYLDKVAITATPNEGYEFIGWSNGETNPVAFVTVESDTVITAIFVLEGQSGVNDVTDEFDVSLTPNPVRPGMVAHVYGEFGEVESIEILNNSGQVIDRFAPSSYPIEIDGLEVDGLYYVRIINRSGEIFTEKLLVK